MEINHLIYVNHIGIYLEGVKNSLLAAILIIYRSVEKVFLQSESCNDKYPPPF